MIDELRRELDAAGVRGRWQRRALEEAQDHVAELGAGGTGAFGDPRAVAQEIAGVVATTRTRSAALATFGALALTGVGYIAAFSAVNRTGSPDVTSGRSAALGIVAVLGIVILPQLAFVAGMLMAWRALRLPTPATAGDLQVVRRRAAVALVSAAGTVAAWIVWAWQFSGSIEQTWKVRAVALGSVALLPVLAVAASRVAAASRPRAVPGRGGDLFDDLEPLVAHTPFQVRSLRAHQTAFAGAVAAGVGLAMTAFGWHAEGSLGEGLVRGIPEAASMLLLYVALGRVLALRR